MLSISKKDKKTKICSKVIFRRNIWSQGTGLMFHRKIKDEAHIFVFRKEKKIGITMMFVFFPLDIIFVDKNKKIVELKENLKPFQDYFPKNKAMYVVEVQKGDIKKNKLKTGQKLSF